MHSQSILHQRALAFVVLALIVGCQSLPRALRVDISAPEKDVIVHHVEVSGPLQPRQYFLLAEEQRHRVAERARSPFDVPVYEFYCSFRTPEKTVLATVHYRCPDEPGPGNERLEHHETRVYRTVDR